MKKMLLVSGNSSIGPEIIKEFLKNKYNIISTYNKKKLYLKNKNLKQIKLDLNSEIEKNLFLEKIQKNKFDSIIFCSGLIYGKNFLGYNFDEAKNIFNINFFGILSIFKYLLKNFNKDASIIFISSISSEQGSYDPFYAASKAALNMMVKNLAKEFAKNMRIISISPSLIKNSKMYFDMSAKVRKNHIIKNPQKSLVEKKDLAKILLTLSSKEWKKLNGINLNLNGGI